MLKPDLSAMTLRGRGLSKVTRFRESLPYTDGIIGLIKEIKGSMCTLSTMGG